MKKKLRKAWYSRKKAPRVTSFNPSTTGPGGGPGSGRSGPRKRKTTESASKMDLKAPFVAALRLVPYVLVALFAASLPLLSYQVYIVLLSSPYLALNEIEVVGANRIAVEMVIAASGLEKGVNILKIDEDLVEKQLGHLPWVKRVNVEREIPDRVVVRIEERVAAALLAGKSVFLVDEDGYLFKEMAPDEFDPDLLVIGGLEATRLIKMGEERRVRETLTEALAIRRDYRSMGLDRFYRITEIQCDELLGFTLVSRGSQRFMLGFGEYPEKLRRLGTVLADLEKRGSGVDVVRLDNEKQPWKVAVGGTGVKLEDRRRGRLIPAPGMELLP